MSTCLAVCSINDLGHTRGTLLSRNLCGLIGVVALWHGTTVEGAELQRAIARNCECQYGAFGVRIATCKPHEALMSDQRFLDGLLLMRRLRARLVAEEDKR